MTLTKILEGEHKRIETIINHYSKNDLVGDIPKTFMHLIQASNSLRYAVNASKEEAKNKGTKKQSGPDRRKVENGGNVQSNRTNRNVSC